MLDFLQAGAEEYKRVFDEEKKICTSLHSLVENLQVELKESRLDSNKLKQEIEQLKENVIAITSELENLRAREAIRIKTDTHILQCIAGISKCRNAVEKLIVFIEDAITNKFLDPSLLFSTCDGSVYFHHIVVMT